MEKWLRVEGNSPLTFKCPCSDWEEGDDVTFVRCQNYDLPRTPVLCACEEAVRTLLTTAPHRRLSHSLFVPTIHSAFLHSTHSLLCLLPHYGYPSLPLSPLPTFLLLLPLPLSLHSSYALV